MTYWLPLVAWAGLIFCFSALTGLGENSEPDVWFYLIRKGAHVGEYAILAGLFWRLLKFYFPKETAEKMTLATVLCALSYAFTDETHQLFVAGREGKLFDVGVDLLGILLALFLINVFTRKTGKKRVGKRRTRK